MLTTTRFMDEWLGFPDLFAYRTQWSPAVTFDHSDQHYGIVMDLPGVSKPQVKASYSGSVLTIEGERSLQGATRTFRKQFQIPKDAQPQEIEAHMQDGVLTLRIPKGETGTQEIQIT